MRRVFRLTSQAYAEVGDLLLEVPALQANEVAELVLDMGAVVLLDSMLIGQLVRLQLACGRSGFALKLDGLSPNVLRTLTFSGVGELFGFETPDPPSFHAREAPGT